MTVPFPLGELEDVILVRKKPWLRRNRDKAASIGVTAAIHLVVIGVAVLAVTPPPTRAPEVLTVQISQEKRTEIVPSPVPQPVLTRPTVLNTPMPEFLVQPSPKAMVAQISPPQPAPPAAPGLAKQEPVVGQNTYFAQLLAHLNRYKRYPSSARMGRVSGTAMIHFVMDSEGKVLSFELATSSGSAALDEEALALIRRAQPLPSLPEGFPTRTLDAVVPIDFRLDRASR